MPTYKNISTIRKELAGKTVEPGQVIHTLGYYNENDVGLLKVDDKPFFNPTILSCKMTQSGVIKIPEKDNIGAPIMKFAVHFYIEKGYADIKYNSADNNPGLLLYEGARWNVRCFEHNIDNIIVTGMAGAFVLYVIVEKIQ